MGTSSSNNKPYLITIIILLLVIIGGGVYFLFFNSNNNQVEHKHSLVPDTANTNDDKDATTYTKDTPLGKLECVKDQKPNADYCKIDSSSIINAQKGFTYTLTDNDDDLQKFAKIEIDKDDNKKVTVTFDEKMVEHYYGEKGLNYPIYFTFSREVDSYKIASFGQGVGNEYIFFVMKDGNLAMVSVYTMLKDKNYDPHMMSNVKDVTDVVSGSSYGEYGGSHTDYAVTKNKMAYDLQPLLPSLTSNE
jgi:hypothetical protein